MEPTVAFAPVIQWAIGLGAAWAAVIAAAVYALQRQATDRLSAETGALKEHIDAQATDLNAVLSRLANENIDIRGRVGVLHERVEKLDGRTLQAPTIDSVHVMAIQVERMGGDVRAVKTELTGLREIMQRVEKQLDRHEDALLAERRPA